MADTYNNITITEHPVTQWFIGAVLSGFGLVMVLQHDAPTLMGVFFLLIGVLLLLNSPLTTVILDRNQNNLVLQKRTLIRLDNLEIPLNEIVNIVLKPRPRNSWFLQLSVLLQDGSEIPLTGISRKDEEEMQTQLSQMRQILGLNNSLKQTAFSASPAESGQDDFEFTSPGNGHQENK